MEFFNPQKKRFTAKDAKDAEEKQESEKP